MVWVFFLFFLLDKKERKNQDCAIRPPLWHSGGGPVPLPKATSKNLIRDS
jgi:hypothetical protein